MIHTRHVIPVLKETYAIWRKSNPSFLAAALSYYSFFSLVPFLIIVLALGSLLLGTSAVEGTLVGEISFVVGEANAQAIQQMIITTYSQASGAILGIGAILLIFGASNLFTQLRNTINQVWGIHEKTSIKNFLYNKLVSVIVLIIVSVIFVAWMVANTAFLSLMLPSTHPPREGLLMAVPEILRQRRM